MELLGLYWSRPAALLALSVPIGIALLVRRPGSPRSAATGTLPLWREVAGRAPVGGSRRRPRLPPGLVLLLLSLVLGTLALAGPRASAPPGLTWTVVLDRSPSMYLPHLPGGGQTRLSVALRALERWRQSELSAGDQLLWVDVDGASRVAHRAERPPHEWGAAPLIQREAPPWAAFDRPGTLWVTDAAESVPTARYAGLVASGGSDVPGAAVLSSNGALLWWGGELRPSADPMPVRTVAVDAGLPVEVRELARVWCEARGLAMVAEPDELTALHVAGVGSAGSGPGVRAGRDGWFASGPAAPGAGSLGLERWLAAPGGALVARRVGRVEVAWSRLDELDGDPAAFAVSWSRLFDESLAPPREIVSVAERQDAGEQTERAPAAPQVRPAGSQAGAAVPSVSWLEAVLAGVAALLAVCALYLRA